MGVMRPAAIVLAAGAGSRFSTQPGQKLLASVDGRPMLSVILATLREFRPAATIVVLGHAADAVEATIAWVDEVRVRNPSPSRGMGSSLLVGFEALDDLSLDIDGAFVVLGDQPGLRTSTLEALEAAAAASDAQERLLVVPRYADDPGPRNPVLVRRAGWRLIGELRGDHGLAPLISRHPELCLDVAVPGAMPDIDRPEDLDSLRLR
jgi:molybdenum cofactor cytidylyltransferase